jgi:hypothetical protein
VPWGQAGGRAFGRTDGQIDSQTDVRKLIVPFRNFVNAPKNGRLSLHRSFVFKMAILRSRATPIIQFTSTVCHQPGIVSILFKFEFILARNLSFWRTKFKIIASFLEVYFWYSAGLLLVFSLACRSGDTVFCIICIHAHRQHPVVSVLLKYHM